VDQRSNERHTALTDAGAHGAAGDDLERLLLIRAAKPQGAAVKADRGDVRSALHVDRFWLDLEALRSQSPPDAQGVLSHRLGALAPATGSNSSSNSDDLA
jgi:hypothetical protein